MPYHRTKSLVPSNGRGAGTVSYICRLYLLEDTIRHGLLHSAFSTIHVRANLLSYICIGNLSIEWNGIKDIEWIKCSHAGDLVELRMSKEVLHIPNLLVHRHIRQP